MTSGTISKPIAREDEFAYLCSIIGKNVPASSCVVLSGPSGCGKTCLSLSVLLHLSEDNKSFRFIDVSCLEVCSSKSTGSTLSSGNIMLFDLILYELKKQFLPSCLQFDYKCDSAAAFIENSADLFHKIAVTEEQGTFCITLHQAEQLRDMPDNILPIIVNLDALVRDHMRIHYPHTRPPNIVTLLLTTCTWDKFYSGTFTSEPTCLYLKAYNREELTKILIGTSPIESPRYGRFIDILLTVCLPVTRNIKELLFLAHFNWKAFDDPVVKGLVDPDDEWGQYRYALPTLKRSLSTIYLRPEHEPNENFDTAVQQKGSAMHQLLELPLYSRYLLVASYIASYNPKAADKRFLVKNTGKLSSRGKHSDKRVEYTNYHLHGPRLFSLDRLVAIFYALLNLESGDDESDRLPPLSSKLIGSVGTLCGLGLLAPASSALAAGCGSSGASGNTALLEASVFGSSGYNDDPLFNPRYRCLVNLETAKVISRSIDIDISRYLLDFV
ncbi:unnamed protein product [Rodentolepis nana]|uniref:Origin recognition complex subunit 5 n=1 Tax=Rodentolepis nana TaxID=102285 RepID=A0A0R3TRB5_RODNA|nr:unnamed protein product [Rodentolepis nana]